MLLHIENVLSADELAHAQALLADAPWADGKITAGSQSGQVKNNLQLPQHSEAGQALSQLVKAAVLRNSTFFSAALPHTVFPPLINCYRQGQNFGNHIDNAVRSDPYSGQWVRTDVSSTLFLNNPDEYDGGELVVQDTFGEQRVKLRAGDMVLYPGTSVHKVEPVTRGYRLACFFWIESMVRSDEQRRLLYELDMNLLQLRKEHGEGPSTTALTGTYHNLLRMWADT